MAANTYKSIFKRYNQSGSWDTYYFATRADQVAEITTGASQRVFVTSDQKTSIDTYLSTFNAANKLVKLDAEGKLATSMMPFTIGDYLTKLNPVFTGNLEGSGGNIDVKGGKILIGAGTATGSLAKWGVLQDALNLRFQHDIGAGLVTSFSVSPTVFDMGGKKISSVATPTSGTDGVNKAYVDNLISAGFSPKEPVMAASAGANVDIAVALNTLDGRTLLSGDRVLLKDQTIASQNGVYELNATKIPVKKSTDSGLGSGVFVEHGDTQNDYIFTTNIANTWVAFSKVDTVQAGTGLEKVGTTLNIVSISNDMLADASVTWAKIANGSALDSRTWAQTTTAATDGSISSKLTDVLSAIKLARGTANYNTSNTQTIAGAYSLAETKNRTYRGDGAPSGTGYVEGDLYFEGVAI